MADGCRASYGSGAPARDGFCFEAACLRVYQCMGLLAAHAPRTFTLLCRLAPPLDFRRRLRAGRRGAGTAATRTPPPTSTTRAAAGRRRKRRAPTRARAPACLCELPGCLCEPPRVCVSCECAPPACAPSGWAGVPGCTLSCILTCPLAVLCACRETRWQLAEFDSPDVVMPLPLPTPPCRDGSQGGGSTGRARSGSVGRDEHGALCVLCWLVPACLMQRADRNRLRMPPNRPPAFGVACLALPHIRHTIDGLPASMCCPTNRRQVHFGAAAAGPARAPRRGRRRHLQAGGSRGASTGKAAHVHGCAFRVPRFRLWEKRALWVVVGRWLRMHQMRLPHSPHSRPTLCVPKLLQARLRVWRSSAA